MEAFAKAKFQREGSRKVNLVLDQVRKKNVQEALEVLPFIEKGTADLVYKTLHSAAANLEVKAGKKIDMSKVYIKEAFANIGPMRNLRRIQPGPQGRAMPYKKSMCHLTVVVSDEKGGR
ncbi:large subunit ribosomal protein L22 [Elusimicrobium posterum]|uniref:50S ribosomal protein L22 n=1 Tax=Elusimicrobium posterum TaxID=3116653 RepID=UPI003C73CB78